MTPILLCVLAAALMPIVCAGIAKAGRFGVPRRDGGYDNHQPRAWLAQQSGYRGRANAAQANCFEAMPFFIGALALALVAGAPQPRVQALALLWVLLRCAYVAAYVGDKASLRSVVWVAALAVNAVLLFAPLF